MKIYVALITAVAAGILALADGACNNHPWVSEPVDVGNGRSCTCNQLNYMCTREYSPVCDNSNNTHSNFCVMCAAIGSQLTVNDNATFTIRFQSQGACPTATTIN